MCTNALAAGSVVEWKEAEEDCWPGTRQRGCRCMEHCAVIQSGSVSDEADACEDQSSGLVVDVMAGM